MHQHPRPPPSTASPANSEQTNPTRTNNPRDRDVQALRTASTQASGSSDDFGTPRQDSASDNNPAAQMQRLNQVIQNFHTKAALIVLHSRVDLPEAYSAKTNEKRVNRWFNIELDETDEYNDEIRRWRRSDVLSDRPPPLIIEIFLTTEPLAQGQRLIILDEEQKRWDVSTALASLKKSKGRRGTTETDEVLLERWTIELGEQSAKLPSDLTSVLPLVYKKSIVLFRSLYTCCNFLPVWKLSKKVGRSRHHMAMRIGYRIVDGTLMQDLPRPDTLEAPLCDSNSTADVTTVYNFGVTDSPAGPFSVKVQYRENCDFRIDDTEELLSSRFLGADDDLFRPSISREEQPATEREAAKVGSLPNDARRHLRERPELGHAYGSMSTFHQVGFSPGTSPISALRSARELGPPSPSPEQTRPLPQAHNSSQGRSSLRAVAAGRRSSISLQPFKAPTLSASPLGASPLGTSPRVSANRVPTLGSLNEEAGLPLPNAQAVAARRTGSFASEQTAPSSGASSPKPAPVRYSSSFSHRKSRPSIDRIASKPDDDQNSSGRGSATSTAVPPGSGLLAEPPIGGTSSGSMQEDGENISDFLKMLDIKKDKVGHNASNPSEEATTRTTAALNRFRGMRDTNAALSDSMSSSLMMQRSSQSSSRQLSSVPQMIAPTSASTASSPGKPISPHTPHTPFAPSRLSAAYSHDDAEEQQRIAMEVGHSPDQTSQSDDTARAESNANVPAIDIPNSPRTLLVNYRRSNSAQRGPISSDDDLGDPYGNRSASMGAQDRKSNRSALAAEPLTVPSDGDVQGNTSDQHRTATSRKKTLLGFTDGATSDLGSGRSSTNNVYRSRLSKEGTARGRTSVTPPQGSTSSFGGTGGSLERGGDSGGSTSDMWARGGRYRTSTRTERPESKAMLDDDEFFLPFAIDKSDFPTGKNTDVGER